MPFARKQENFYSPALDFEKKHGLQGIGRKYIIPNVSQPLELDRLLVNQYDVENDWMKSFLSMPFGKRLHAYFARDSERFLRNTLRNVIEANPELRTVRYNDDVSSIFKFLRGVASGFNPDDIDYFLNDYRAPKGAVTPIDIAAPYLISWVASPRTEQSIERQLAQKQQMQNEIDEDQANKEKFAGKISSKSLEPSKAF